VAKAAVKAAAAIARRALNIKAIQDQKNLRKLHDANPDPAFWKAVAKYGPRGMAKIAESIRNQKLTRAAADIAQNPDEWGGNVVAGCGNIQVQLVFGWEGEGCAINDGDTFTVIRFSGKGFGAAYVGVGAGPLISNATSVDDLLGASICGGAGIGADLAGGVEVCFGLNDDGSASGIWTLWEGGGAGWGVDAHLVKGNTSVVFTYDYPNPHLPCVGGSAHIPGVGKVSAHVGGC
jgi:hypothetical protein